MFLATWFHPKMRIRVPSGVREFWRTGQVAALRVIADFWGDHRSNSSGWSNIIIQPDQCTSIHMSTQHLPGKNCRNPADDTPGNPDAKLHLPVKSEKKHIRPPHTNHSAIKSKPHGTTVANSKKRQNLSNSWHPWRDI